MRWKMKAGKKAVCTVFTVKCFCNTEGKTVSENCNLIRFCYLMNYSERFLRRKL